MYYYDEESCKEAERKEAEKEKREKARLKRLKVLIALVLVFILSVVGFFMVTERVPQGYVGVVYSMNGGVQDTVLTQGWHFVSPIKKVTTYSVATEQLLMTKSETEGSPIDESFDVSCKDGRMNVDIEMAYSFKAEEVPAVFTRYRGMSGEDVVNNIIKSKVKRYVGEITSKYTVMECYMDKKAELNIELTETMTKKLQEYGVSVESCSITRVQLDPSIEEAMVKRSKVAQELEAAKQEQEKTRIEAETKVIEAQGTASAAIETARGEAEANKLVAASITDPLIQMMNAEARKTHGWVTIQGGTPIVDAKSE